MIYFIQEGSDVVGKGRIKIGSSERPFKRLKALQTGNPDPLYIVGIAHYGVTEQELHEQYEAYRIRDTEWFWPGEKLYNYLISGGHFEDWSPWDEDWDESKFRPAMTKEMVRQQIREWHRSKAYYEEYPEELDQ